MPLQSIDSPIELSFDAGITWKELVCMSNYTLPTTLSTTVTETFCGPQTGVGSQTFNPTGTAMCQNYGLLTNTQVTYGELLALQTARTQFLYRAQAPGTGSTGRDYYQSGSVYCTSLTLTAQVGSVLNFSFTLSGSGALDITP